MSDTRSRLARTAYPDGLRDAEAARWALGLDGRYGTGPRPDRPRVGVALSGGGIRSATFSLGVFQAFSRVGFLRHVDFLSTISGGGYFGSFLGALFTRDYIRSTDDVASVLAGSAQGHGDDPQELRKARFKVVDWLRENGRYLSPRGSGDMLLFLTSLFRNWMALNIVIAFLGITTALVMQLPRYLAFVDRVSPRLSDDALIWWSPWIASAGLPLLLVPSVTWAYFLRDDQRRAVVISVVTSTLVAVLVSLGYWRHWPWIGTSRAAVAGAVAMVWIILGAVICRMAADEKSGLAGNLLTQWLRALLAAAAVLLGLGVIDSLGQTAYFHVKAGTTETWIASIAAAIAGIGAFARQITVLLGSKIEGDRPRLPVAVLATVAAGLLLLFLTVLYSAVAHAVAWGFDLPQSRIAFISYAGWLAALGALTWAFGHTWRFVNQSTQQPLYSARLARAYLGASNPQRWDGSTVPVIEPLKSDDFDMAQYWPGLGAGGEVRYRKGAPLHLMSVTINATVGGRSQVEQRDRKGIGMAVGPAGISVGVRHHAVFAETERAVGPKAERARDVAQLSARDLEIASGFNALDYGQAKATVPFTGEALKLSMWTGLSGAAFSTGVGSRTNLGLSLLTGFMNVRLGYWWSPGVTPPAAPTTQSQARKAARWFGLAFERALPVHKYLADEFLARFPGVSRRHWYLSDGGHFENLGAYELLRRRVPLIVLIDSGEDADYVFGDLGTLVRKARTDFDAAIRFLTREELTSVGIQAGHAIGTLEDLRPRCGEVEECEKERGTGRAYSGAYAALATVTFEAGGPSAESTSLLYVKPGLLGVEDVDLINYGRGKPAFPHESTADQFFDDAQWESYRRLGESIVGRVWRDLELDDPATLIARMQRVQAGSS